MPYLGCFTRPPTLNTPGSAGDVEAMALATPDAWDQQRRQDDGDDADGNVDEEDPAPPQVGDDKATQRRSRDDGETGECSKDAEDGAELLSREDAHRDRKHLRRHDRPAQALQGAGGDQLGRPV